ncbi:ankyrin repeat family protein [Artemisia annua]|uniref:Ankyrin repeat family protein n=1 Tax=Artemisia annua TaxID=35608 RepID=A0A2U1NCG2_ARTAN|nr:ankyrin repeat family protein [Artemisia annua]
MASSSTTSDRNINTEDHAIVFVAYNGKWEYDGKEWFFKNSRSSIMVVPKHVTLSEITGILYKQLKVNKKLYRLKLEVHYRTGSPWFPVTEIQNNQDLLVFISVTSKTKLPLCVTQIYDEFTNVVQDRVTSGVDEERRKDDKVENRLIKAIRKDDWMKAREIVNTQGVTWTSKLDDDGNTALHFAVSRYKDNEVVRDILKEINSELLATTVNIAGFNPAHHAAAFGNTEALKIMLDSNPKCLYTPDNYDLLAIHYALAIPAIETFLYFFNKMKSCETEYDKLFRGMRGINLLHQVLDTGLIDVAYELINGYPSLATTVYRDKTVLDCIIRKPELFYCGTSYRFYSRFVYQIVPIKNNSLGSNDTADVENQETRNKDKFVTKHTRKCLHTVPHIKHLKDDKVKHNTTIKLLRRICEEADRTHTSSDIERLYSSPFCLAVENNNAEALDVLTTYFAGLYASKKDGHNIYQLTVLNRSEKVYNYILHHGYDIKNDFSISIDDDGVGICE